MSRWTVTWCGIMAVVAAGVTLSACGGGQSQDASEPKGNFPVRVPVASFPTTQRLAQHSHLVITVRNAGNKTIPNVAVTICNVTCAYPAPRGEGTNAGAFAQDISQSGLANPSRPVWIIDKPPKPAPKLPDGQAGTAGGAVTAYSNTWALGPLRPGATAQFDWAVTAIVPGRHVVAWEIAAGLNGKAKAVLEDGTKPHGKFTVMISKAPANTYVTNSGQIATQK